MMPNDSYYDILNVEPTATQAEISKSYRKIALQHHPDKNKNNGKATKDFSTVNEAYECLKCPERRKEYDLSNPPPPRINPAFKDIFDTYCKPRSLNR
tara:strand:- start:5642 stop:5932 length:291 start_codon:yes stop_codon:yes gene_type:complete